MTTVQTFQAGNATGVLIGDTLHILKWGQSTFRLLSPAGEGRQYACQKDCCDDGTETDVFGVVFQAKNSAGAKKVVLRAGRDLEICGLPVIDVERCDKELAEGWQITRKT